MLSSSTSRLALLTILCALLGAASSAPAASAAAQRYASPTGTGTDCSSADPCDIRQAVEKASWGDEVIVNTGDYELTKNLATPYAITIHGVAGQPRPRLLFKGVGQNELRVDHGSTLRYVEVEQAPGNGWPALYASSNSLVDRVIAKASGGGTTAYIQRSTIRNSIVVQSSPFGGVALETAANGAHSISTYRNVTAIAPNGYAIKAFALTDTAKILARNVIARGGPGIASLQVQANQGTTATITVDHSNWSGQLTGGAGAATIVDGGGNQSAAPAFVSAAAGDYRQAAGSPTIDAGLDEFINGDVDVEGDPRQIGDGTDIGADEFFVAPAATTGPAGAATDDSATLTGSVNPNGATTVYWFEYGPTTAYGSTTPTVSAGSGTAAVAAAATLGGLNPETTYHYRLMAGNGGVTTKGADQTFTTASTPQPTPTPPPPSPTPPPTPTPSPPSAPAPSPSSSPPPFAGIELVSPRLAYARRFITVRLSCPAATVGRCSGRTKLTGRQRRTSSRPASRITLGRATFSIAPGQQAKVKVRVTRAGRRLPRGVRRLRGRVRNAARDGAGQSKTTVARVTIRRRHR